MTWARMRRGLTALLIAAMTAAAGVAPASPAAAAPPDKQWYLDLINVPAAHHVTRGEGVTIGLLTGGRPVAHPDLGDAALPTVGHGRGVPAGEFQVVDADYPAPDRYATGEMGLMVAQGGSGLLGVAPGAKVQPVICAGPQKDTEACIRWLVDGGVDVINLATASFPRLDSDFDGIRYAMSHDVVVVAALEEGAQAPRDVMAGVLLVGGVDRNGELPQSARPNDRVGLRAPGTGPVVRAGDEIVGLVPDAADGYGTLRMPGGDEVASALVTGVVALVRSRYPEMKAPSVVNQILVTAADRNLPGRDGTYGYGIVDSAAAVTREVPGVALNPLGDPGEPRSAGAASFLVVVAVVGAVILAAAAVAAFVLLVWLRRRRRRRAG